MAKSPHDLDCLRESLAIYGLVIFGGLEVSSSECAKDNEEFIGKKSLLIGNAGSSMWRKFSMSNEYADGKRDSMNRWAKRILDEITQTLGARVVYPFDEPYWPFQQLAQKAAGVQASPLGILIHPKFGLWHAFHGLIIFDEAHEFMIQINTLIEQREVLIHPCDACEDKPCLSACPVGAFAGERLDVKNCFTHLDKDETPHCMKRGCQARGACPIAKESQYDEAQIQFHMKSYRGI